jgi:DNA polymerase-4
MKVKFADFQIITRSRSEFEPITTREMFERASLELLGGIMPVPKPVRLIGVSLHNLGPAEEKNASPQMAFAL